MSLEEWDDVIAVHLRGAFLVTETAAGYEGERRWSYSPGDRTLGWLEALGRRTTPRRAGMMGLLRTCVLELARLNIRTNALWPIAETDMTEWCSTGQAKRRRNPGPSEPTSLGFGSTEAVAEGLAWL